MIVINIASPNSPLPADFNSSKQRLLPGPPVVHSHAVCIYGPVCGIISLAFADEDISKIDKIMILTILKDTISRRILWVGSCI